VIQAIEWRLSPYAVANKSYSVNDRLAFESQLIQAVILQRAPIKGRLKVEYTGEGAARVCRVWAELKDTGEIVEYYSPPFAKITPKNSPLWVSDPDQQQFYYSARALCRRHFPDVLLGIYARDELEDSPRIGPDRARDVTPAKTIAEKLDALTKAQDAVPDPADDWSQPVPEFFTEELPPEPDPHEPIRELARADAERRIRRMAPTKLSDEEKEIYLQAFDAHRAAEAG
jgi:RecT family